MDLIGGYLLILLVLFAANISLIFGNYRLNNIKLIMASLMFSVMTFLLIYASGYLEIQQIFLLDNFSYIFLVIAILIFASTVYYVKTDNFKLPLYVVSAVYFMSVVLFASQSTLDISSTVSYSLFVFLIMFIVYQLTKLLRHAKRQYSVIVGEYMSLSSILMFIFALTYNSTRNLDYTMFSPFLILTPTYQLIYVIIGIIVVLVVGVVINDNKGGNS
nr:peptide ABC transporter permease [uncultured Methanobrevibacter sp.]